MAITRMAKSGKSLLMLEAGKHQHEEEYAQSKTFHTTDPKITTQKSHCGEPLVMGRTYRSPTLKITSKQ
jgi:hypothetical protein